MHLSVSPVGSVWLVALVAAVLLGLLWLGPAREKLTAARRRTLLGLRVAVIALTVLALLRPAWVHTIITRQSATLILLLDQSRSMRVADGAGKQSRWEVLKSAVYNALPRLVDLGRDIEVQFYSFDAEPKRLDWDQGGFQLPEQPDGNESAIGHALDEITRLSASKRLAGVILVSDGTQRAGPRRDEAPQIAARELARRGFPLYTVPLGQAGGVGQVRDIALSDLRAPASVFIKNELPIGAAVRVDGFVNQKLPVQLLVETEPGKMTPIEAHAVQAGEDGQEFAVELKHLPAVAGEIKVTLQVTPQPGETITANNTLSTFVTVKAEGLSVLYLEGLSRVEQKFLRRALDASPDIRVDYLRLDAQRPQLNPRDVADRFQPGKYDVYLIGDLDSSALSGADWKQLADAVNAGAGLMMLGGMHSFGAGGYGQTPLAEVLPIEIGRLERQNFGEAIRPDLHLSEPPRLLPTAVGRTQSLLALDAPANNDAAWSALPPLDGANRFTGLKPGAQVLLESQRREPLLVAKNFGSGRVLAFAGDSTWRWPLHGYQQQHQRFWRQTILWLAQKELRQDGQVWVALERRRFAPGARVDFTAGARSEQGEPLADAQITAEVIAPDGRKLPARLNRASDGTQQGVVLDALEPGDYTIRVSAAVAGVNIGLSQARFLIYEQDLELENPAADRGTLEAIAAMTGGKTIAPEQLADLIDEIRAASSQFEVETQVKDTLWDTWPFFLLFVLLLSLEWYFRKKWGLV